MFPKKPQSFLSQAFKECSSTSRCALPNIKPVTDPLVALQSQNEIPNNNNLQIDNEFDDDDEMFSQMCDTLIINENHNNAQTILSKPELNVDIVPVKLSNKDNNESILSSTQGSRSTNSNFLSNALSQSIGANNVNSSKQLNYADYELLLKERDRLREEVFSAEGKLKLTINGEKRNLDNRDKKIKELQEELNKTKIADKKLIDSLRSELEFKNANEMASKQKLVQTESLQNLTDGNCSLSEEFPSSQSKRLKLHKTQPSPIRNIFFSKSTNKDAGNSNKPEIKSTQKSIDIVSVSQISQANIVESVRIDNRVEEPMCIDDETGTKEIIDADPNIVDIVRQEKRIISRLQSNPVDEWSELLLLVSEYNQPMKCCQLMDTDRVCQYSAPIVTKLVEIISEKYATEYDVRVHDGTKETPKILNDLKILKGSIGPQMQKLAKSLHNRPGALTYTTIKRIISYKYFMKQELFINPKYFCSYIYIYPVWESLKKLLFLKSDDPFIVGDLFADCVVPILFDVLNGFVYVFCCQPKKSDISGDCRCLTGSLEMDFVGFVLEATIDVLNRGVHVDNIYRELFTLFPNLLPLFGSRLDLRVTVLKLFNKMLTYNVTYRRSNIIDEHKNPCLLVIILDLLKCKCLETNEDNRTNEILDNVLDLVYSMCESGFNWNLKCKCTEKLFQLLIHLGRIVIENIMASKSLSTSLDSYKRLLMTLVHLHASHGTDTYRTLTDNREYRSLLLTGYIYSKSHLHKIPECSQVTFLTMDHYFNVLVNISN